MKNKKFVLIPLVILVAGFLIMQLLSSLKSEPPKRVHSEHAKSVAFEVVKLREQPTVINGLGRLTSTRPVQLYSEATGTLLRGDVDFLPAQGFRKGNVLLRIDDRQVRLNLNSAKSDFLTALASVLPEIKIDFPEEYTIWQQYFDSCGFDKTLSELPEAANQKIKLYLSRFNVYKLYFSVQNHEILLEKHSIRAPFNGTIVSTALREGSTARNGSLLGNIMSLEDMEIEIPVPAEDLRWLDKKQVVTISSSELEGSWNGKIRRVGKFIDPKTQTLPVYVSVAGNGTQLYEGIYLRAEIPGRPVPNAVSVPRRAVYNDSYVWLIDDGKLRQRKIHIARHERLSMIIDRGLENGDTLITEVLHGIAEGMPAKARRKIANDVPAADADPADADAGPDAMNTDAGNTETSDVNRTSAKGASR